MPILISNWRLIAAVVLIAGNVLFYNLWQDSKAEQAGVVSGIEAIGRQAVIDKKAEEKAHEDNLRKLTDEYESKLPEIKSAAVAAYAARHPRIVRVQTPPGASGLPNTPASVQMDDGKRSECIPDDQFIQDAAECEAKLGAWQRYGQLNSVPVE